MDELTGFQRDLLYVILDSVEPSGQEIQDHINEYYTEKINHGRLYPNLDELVDLGLIVKGKKDDRTNSYAITQKGKDKIVKRHAWENKYIEDTGVDEEVKSITS
jgi:DNA-binding PadR family transcriptional regulator